MCLHGMLPGDLPKPGGPRPNAAPPEACTTLGLLAVDGDSSSVLSGLTRFPLTHRAPDMAATEPGLDVVLLHYLIHPGAPHSPMDCPRGLDPDLEALLQTIHILLLYLWHVHLPIELEVCNMEKGEHTLESADLDQVGLGLLQVTATLMRSVYSESLVHQEVSIESICLEIVLRTFSGSDSTLLLGTECSSLHMLAAKCESSQTFPGC